MATLRYGDDSYEVEAGQDVLGALLDNGASLPYICMAGSCGTCRIIVTAGAEHLSPPESMEVVHGCGGSDGSRLACQVIVIGTGTVAIRAG